jgi:hypothetical protein
MTEPTQVQTMHTSMPRKPSRDMTVPSCPTEGCR